MVGDLFLILIMSLGVFLLAAPGVLKIKSKILMAKILLGGCSLIAFSLVYGLVYLG